MKIFLITFFCLIFVLGSMFLFFSLQKPLPLSASMRQKALTSLTQGNSMVTTIPRKTGWTFYNGKYIRVMYPVAAKQYPTPSDGKETNLIENFQFQEILPKYFFVVQVFNQPHVSTFDDISAVRLRRTQKDIYTEGSVELGNMTAITFTKSHDGFEKSAFMFSGEHVYTLVITSSDSQTENLFDHILHSVQIN